MVSYVERSAWLGVLFLDPRESMISSQSNDHAARR